MLGAVAVKHQADLVVRGSIDWRAQLSVRDLITNGVRHIAGRGKLEWTPDPILKILLVFVDIHLIGTQPTQVSLGLLTFANQKYPRVLSTLMKRHSCSQKRWPLVPDLVLTSCVTLGRPHNLSGLQFLESMTKELH